MRHEYCAAMSAPVDERLRRHLIRPDGQEDLAFALWTPSMGASRLTALVHTVLLPAKGDREVHGNASFNQQYFDRVCREALAAGAGIAFLHSHPFPGWQGMSEDDVFAEQQVLAGAVSGLTELPLLGLTVSSDGKWSGRFWEHAGARDYRREWCSAVRVIGSQLSVTFADRVLPRPQFQDRFRRTVSVWGSEPHASLARLRIGIVGLGSVGALVAETLARMGMTRFTLIDFDRVEPHNLDRLVTATIADVGRLKVDVAKDRIEAVATAASVDVRAVLASVAEEAGYRAALDCDVVFSCVDRPRARHILNHFAYAHLIPVIDGGIGARFRDQQFTGVDWQVQTVGPGRSCLECLKTYDQADVSTEIAGKLDDPSYLAGLAHDHRFKRNENVFPFSANLASLEVLQLVALVTGAAGVLDFGVQRYRYNPGILEQVEPIVCTAHCEAGQLVASGDRYFTLMGRDLSAERSRAGHAFEYEVPGS
jgi:molybdopterin-synthase adenylyltransferase